MKGQSMPRTNPLDRFNCGPVTFSGSSDALYERHLTFDQVVPVAAATPRDKFEAVARSVRDLLSQRWIKTEQTYQARNVETGLLPVARIPDGPLAGEQHHQPVARPGLEPVLQEAQARSARDHRAGARRRSRQRRARPAGGVLPRFDGHARHSGHGLRPALRVRHLQADRCATAGSTSSRITGSPGPTRGKSRGRTKPSKCGWPARSTFTAGALRTVHGPAVDAHRHSVRPPGGRLRRQDHQHAAPVVRRHAGLLRLPAVQRRRLRRRAGRDAHGRNADARALPGRLDHGRQGAALPAAVLPGGLHAGRRDPPFPRRRQRLVRAARQGRDAAQRHASDARGPRADADPPRRREARVGRGLGSHAAHARLHEPHAAARSAGEVAAAVVRDDAAAAARDHLRNQPPLPRRRARAVSPATTHGSRA